MRNWPKKVLAILPKMARLLVFIAVVYGIAMAFAVRQARAEVEEIMLGLGAEMMHHPGAAESDVRQLRLNGAEIQMRTGYVDAPMDDVLSFFEQKCQNRDGQFAAQMADFAERIPELADVDPSEVDGTMVMNTGVRGYVACLDTGDQALDHNDVITRVTSFLSSGNLSDVGQMRYLYAERSEENDSTFFMTMFSDSDLNLYQMFPTVGDVPGTDPVQRPEGSRRLLSSAEHGAPYGVTVFAAEESTVDRFLSHYESAMPEDGWEPVEAHAGQRFSVDDVSILTYARADELITIAVQQDGPLTVSTVLQSADE